MLDGLADITWRNPIFMLVLFGVVWYLPGLILRRVTEAKKIENKKKIQQDKISRLYPKD